MVMFVENSIGESKSREVVSGVGNEEFSKKEVFSDISGFYKRNSLSTPAEMRFFYNLREAWGREYDVYPQVHVGAVFAPKSHYRNWGELNKLNKRIDFLLVDKEKQSPVLAIELDDWSHNSMRARTRDRFVEDLFVGNKIPFVRFNQGNYDALEIRKRLFTAFDKDVYLRI